MERRIGEDSFEEDPGWMEIARDSYWSTYIFDPEGITRLPSRLRTLDLQTEGGTTKAGREAVRLVGMSAEGQTPDLDLPWWGADRYELSVDVERGIILHAAALLRGEEIDSLEVEEIAFDKRFPEDVFTSPEQLPWG